MYSLINFALLAFEVSWIVTLLIVAVLLVVKIKTDENNPYR